MSATGKGRVSIGVLAAIVLCAAALPETAMADVQKREFQVVGTWGNLELWKEHESKFWNETLPRASGGKLTANAKPYTEVGLSGFEVMRLLRLGAYDVVHAVATYVAQDSPALEGMDLAGVTQDLDTYRKAMDAYKGVLERELSDKYNAKLLMVYSFPSQQLYCNLGGKNNKKVHLADLKGKKIRTYSTTLGDFIEGLNASAVTIAFAEVVPALQKGVADCGITGTTPAYSAKWWQVVTHNIRVRLGYAATVLAMNMDTWDSLNDDTRKLMTAQVAKLEDEIWASTKAADKRGMDCNAAGPCALGEPGGMVPVEANAADKAQLKDIVENYVVKRWAKRCGVACAKEWNDTVGRVVGVKAPL
jgi:TRAP-type C4-dicarboxylate transport system substrate-binding protein